MKNKMSKIIYDSDEEGYLSDGDSPIDVNRKVKELFDQGHSLNNHEDFSLFVETYLEYLL